MKVIPDVSKLPTRGGGDIGKTKIMKFSIEALHEKRRNDSRNAMAKKFIEESDSRKFLFRDRMYCRLFKRLLRTKTDQRISKVKIFFGCPLCDLEKWAYF